ncbi:uncharacterized protein LOC131677351 [Topomyia yanbarensis]|uniref:uncharacterized protein LOC131677351 n=1 Tax=Topomyia yanbarensis TaxID=2498891 RepID=UPI00273BA462|nr:uncharacterized protein LOC131677351 [Topomyia yanbarensis]
MAPRNKKSAAKKKQQNVIEEPDVAKEIHRRTTTSENVTNRRRMYQPPRVSQPVAEDDSVIMLSSAENTRITVNEPSLMMLTDVMLRPSTRLSNVDMTLEETMRPTPRNSARSLGPEDTNMSIINVVQTPGIYRDRPKTSYDVRRTEGSAAGVDMDSSIRPVRNRSLNRNIFSGDFLTVPRRRGKTVSRSIRQGEQESLEPVREISIAADMSNRTQEQDLNKTPASEKISEPMRRVRTRSAAKKETLPATRIGTRSASRSREVVATTLDDRTKSNSTVKNKNATKGRSRRKPSEDVNKQSDEVKRKSAENRQVSKSSKKRIKKQILSAKQSESVVSAFEKSIAAVKSTGEPQTSNGKEIANKVTAVVKIPDRARSSTNGEDIAINDVDVKSTDRTRFSNSESMMTHKAEQQPKSVREPENPPKEISKDNNIDAASNVSQCASDDQTTDQGPAKLSESVRFSYVSTRRRPRLKLNKGHSADKSNSRSAIVPSSIHEPSAEFQGELVADKAIRNGSDTRVHEQPEELNKNSEEIQFKSPNAEQFKNVSKRRRPRLAPDGYQNSSSTTVVSTDRVSEKRSSTSSEVNENVSAKTSGSELSHSPDSTKFSTNVARRRRRKMSGDRQIASTSEEALPPTAPSDKEQVSQKPPSDDPTLESTTRRYRTRSASRGRQVPAPKRHKCSCCSGSHTESAHQPKAVTSRGRSRTRKVSDLPQHANRSRGESVRPVDPPLNPSQPESENVVDIEAQVSTTNGQIPALGTRSSRVRSKSVLRNAKNTSSNGVTSRSRSVPRNALLSPVARKSDQSTLGESSHVPIYRRYAEEMGLTRSESMSSLKALLPVEPIPPDGDIYAFDSPSQTPVASSTTGGPTGKKTRTASKKSRSAVTTERKKRTTPAKKAAHCVFGTDMGRIRSVLKKIGGGPVRKPADRKESILDTATVKSFLQPSGLAHVQRTSSRGSSPVSSYTNDDHPYQNNNENDFDIENIPTVEVSVPLSPPKLAPNVRRVLQDKSTAVSTPDKTQPNVTMNFSPLGASSPWRVQNENILPKTFYFSRSKDLLPSYESDIVIRHVDNQSKSPTRELITSIVAPVPSRKTSPTHLASERTINPHPSPSKMDAMFRGIQKSYEQLKVTSEMSDKLISAMRKYKSNVHNQTSLFSKGPDGLSEDERLIAQFREYEANMKKTYQKLKQWYERSQQVLARSIRTIEKVSTLPKTQAQKEMLQNFHRHSEQFVSMINELESAMNDSNIENIAPPKTGGTSDQPAFKEIIMPTRDVNNPHRSPLKTLDIVNMPPSYSPVKSPLVKASFSAFGSSSSKQNSLTKSRDRFSRLSLVKPSTHQALHPPPVATPSLVEIDRTAVEPVNPNCSLPPDDPPQNHPKTDLFGFEEDAADDCFSEPTAVKITKDTLKERLQSVRKMLPPRSPSRSRIIPTTRSVTRLPKVIGSPAKLRPIRSAFISSTPVADKRKPPKQQTEPNVSAIADEQEPPTRTESPPVVLFAEPEIPSMAHSSVNRTYSRIPQRKLRRKRNIYLADLGLSDDDDDDDEETEVGSNASAAEEEEYVTRATKATTRKRKKKDVVQSRKKKTVEQTDEFKKFVDDFNSMCEEVNRFPLVVE